MQNQTVMASGYVTRITKANRLSDSIRVTIPKEIADQVSLSLGDFLYWDWYTDAGKKYIRAKKVE
jgi:bifunctional DNA-binding transcriptional regulator/antitoxin component of YhaV-PrlF toxin-antitoxin module